MRTTEDRVHEEELQSLEMKISRFLRTGVLVAGGVMLIGWLWSSIHARVRWDENPYTVFEAYREMPLSQELSEAFQNGAWPMIFSYAGLVVLISLPVTRVLLTMVLFFKQKERVLAAVALFVLVALITSMLLGFEL